jgi:DNA polymerase-1
LKFPDLHKFPYFTYDTETTGLIYKIDTVFGFSISTPDGKDYYWDVRETPQARKWIGRETRHYNGNIVCHNASFDYRMSDHSGIHLPLERMKDTVIQACQINEQLHSYKLDDLGKKYLGIEKDVTIYYAMKELFGGMATRNVQIGRIWKAPSSIVAPYAKQDTRLTLKLYEWQRKEIKRQGLQQIVNFEHSIMPTFIRQEMRGIRVDLDYTQKAQKKLQPSLNRMQNKLNSIAGGVINVDSSPQIKAMFDPVEVEDGVWQTKSGHPIGTTDKGGPSINAEILRTMEHPSAQLILEIRSLNKMIGTFLGKHVLEHNVEGRVYPSVNQSKTDEASGTGTGRVSYTTPAMQQIPNRDKKKAAIIKPCFLPDEGMVWVDCDKASFEVRVFAHLVKNLEIIQAYLDDPSLDLHEYVAILMGIVRDATYSGQANAKQLNLSMIFNSGNGAIAEKIGLPWDWHTFTTRSGEVVTYKKAGPEATKLIEEYHLRIPGIKQLALGCKKMAESRGYIHTSLGRRLRFDHGYKSYKASGLLIQATAGDINKENIVIVEEQLGKDGHLILNTHDSYSLCLPMKWKRHYKRVKKAIERDRLRVPLLLDWSGAGHNWWDALQKVDNV